MFKKLFFFLIIILITIPAYGENNNSNLYLRSDTKTQNGVVVESNLLVIPADNDFRIKEYHYYIITGQAQAHSNPDILSAAKHNAFLNLLISQGVKSIHNKSELKSSIQYEESVLSYEGFLKSSYVITKQTYNKNKTELSIEMEVWFAPIAYPSEWSFYYFKKKLYELAQNMISVFK